MGARKLAQTCAKYENIESTAALGSGVRCSQYSSVVMNKQYVPGMLGMCLGDEHFGVDIHPGNMNIYIL